MLSGSSSRRRGRRTGRAGASGLAVTLVTRDDTRLIGDIERLIKKKIELEPIELEDDRPLRRPRQRDDEPESMDAALSPQAVQTAVQSVQTAQTAEPSRRGPPAFERPRRQQSAGDPFFDKPYEATGSGGAAWESANKAVLATSGPARGLSPSIKVKRKVASLLGGSQ